MVPTPEFLQQLEQIRDALQPYADDYNLWGVVNSIDDVLRRYGKRP